MAQLTDREQHCKSHFDAAAAEGVTIAEYARRHDLPAQPLYDARRRVLAKSGFARVESPTPVSPTRLEVRLPNGLRVTIASDDVAGVLRAAAAL